MMQYGRGTGRMLAPVLGNLQLGYCSPLCTYRDSIRRVSVSSSLRSSALRFFPPSSSCECDAAAGDCWSSASSSSSAALDASARSSPVSVSFSSDGDLFFSSSDGVEELRSIALQMVHDGYMQGLIREFGAGRSSSSAHHVHAHGHAHGGLSPGLDDEVLLGSWFSELDVEWVLRSGEWGDWVQPLHLELEDGCASLLDMMERWVKALKTMVQVLSITQQELRASKRPAAGGVRKAIRYFVLLATGKMAEREQEVAQFARFAEASILRMLDFVDAVADAALNDDHAPAETLPGMLRVYTCVVDDSPAVLALFEEASTTASMFHAMNSAFLRKMNRLSGAIWSMTEKVRASFVTDDCWRISLLPAESGAGGVHGTTRLVMNYITLVSRNEGALNLVLQDQQRRFRMLQSQPDYCPSSAVMLIKDTIACLEKQLEKTSNFISDPGLRYVFLMNNCSFISQKVSSLLLPSWTLFEEYKIQRSKKWERLPPMDDYVNQPDPNLQEQIETDSNLDGLVKIQSFIEAYLDASWEPVMSCLLPRGFLKLGGTLDEFEHLFWRTCNTQRLWKVPNPELRKKLRKAIIEKVIPGYSKYLTERTAKGKSNRPAKNTPLELEEQLEELFEG